MNMMFLLPKQSAAACQRKKPITMRMAKRLRWALFALALGLPLVCAQQKRLREPDVVFLPTPEVVAEQMLKLADVHEGDVLYDLGSGDGRIVIMAAQRFGARAIGIDINPQRIKESLQNAEKAGMAGKVTFRNEDLFQADFKDATVVSLYLLPALNLKLRPKLWRELKPGTRIVSHNFDMGDWEPQKKVQLEDHTIYLWRIPENAAAMAAQGETRAQ
jgi:SAM-dependent methyltransferase